DDLVATYPDARILWLHRDPVSCIPSVASLMLTFQGAMTRSPAPEAVGAHVDWMYGTGLQRAMDHDTRSASPAWCHHLQYTALVADPLAALRAAYAHFGEELSSEHERRAVAWVGQLSRKAGRHRYGAADFGLTEGGLRERHRAYTERYSVTYEKDRGV
ncbi:MAG: sulfotransferase, partial [Acidobacteria bacterium]|nr:sulfotransferase [Acidobacteriota bacterium]